MERVRMDEDTDLKSAGCKSFGGSIPFLSAESQEKFLTFLFDSYFYFSYLFKKLYYMSRFDELKKQYPELNITILDLLRRIDKSKSYKYMPLLCKIFGSRFDFKKQYLRTDYDSQLLMIRDSLVSKGFSIEGLNNNELFAYYSFQDFFNSSYFQTFSEFVDFMEKGRIENKDVTSYSTIEELRGAVTLASIKEMTKELEGQVIKEHEDETWVIVRPLTFSASAKYGAGTRWCTTYQKEKNYFERYWRQGILVYFINKKTGYKFAGFKGLEDRELSFWNAEDNRVDYLDIDVDDYIFPIVRKIFKSTDTNKNLCSSELQEQVHQECLSEKLYYINDSHRGQEPEEIPTDVTEAIARDIREIYVETRTPEPIYEQPNIA